MDGLYYERSNNTTENSDRQIDMAYNKGRMEKVCDGDVDPMAI